LTVDPESRLDNLLNIIVPCQLSKSDSSYSLENPFNYGLNESICGAFSTQYAWMCDLLGLPYREEVAWASFPN